MTVSRPLTRMQGIVHVWKEISNPGLVIYSLQFSSLGERGWRLHHDQCLSANNVCCQSHLMFIFRFELYFFIIDLC